MQNWKLQALLEAVGILLIIAAIYWVLNIFTQ